MKTGNIITFAQFEEGNLVVNERNVAGYKAILTKIDESYIDDESDGGSISTDTLEEIGVEATYIQILTQAMID